MTPEPGALYRDHAVAVWRYARARMPSDADAEDVTSEVFARAMRAAVGYDPTKGTTGAWVMGIARNTVADWWRRRRPEDPVETIPEGAMVGPDAPSAAAERADAADALRTALSVLSDREREAVALRFGAELSSPEIGNALGISATAARMLVHRAVTKLRGVTANG